MAAMRSILLLLLIVPAPALAQDAAYPIDLSPLVDAAIAAAAVVLTSLAGWLARRAARWLGESADSDMRIGLEMGLANAIGWAREQAERRADDVSRIEVRSRIVAEAAGYLLPKMPAALTHFGIDEEGLRERLEARLAMTVPLRQAHRDGVATVGWQGTDETGE